MKTHKQVYEPIAIRGPLGFWTFPLLNAIIQVLFLLRYVSYAPPVYEPRMKTYQFVRDEKGRIIEILEVEK